MVRLVRSASPFLLVFLTVGISCTIVQDSDINSLDEFSKLNLKSLEINQIGQDEQSKVTKITTSFNNNGQLQQISWPSFNGDKFKFRSSTNKSSATSSLTYNPEGQVSEFDIKSGNTTLEKYTFDYNSDRTLRKLISEGTFPGNIVITVDSIVYASGKPSTLFRTSTQAGGGQTKIIYNIKYNNSDGSVFSFGTNTSNPDMNEYVQNGNEGDCPNGSDHQACNGYQNATGTPTFVTIKNSYNGTKLNSLVLSESYNPGGKTPDKYAFHPLMILRGEIEHSEALLIFYMIDWWTEKYQNSTGGNVKRDLVAINFFYGI